MSRTAELIARAAPVAERLVAGDENAKGGRNLTVWILALKMAIRIEIEMYRLESPERAAELCEDCALMDELLSSMVVMPDPRGNAGDGFSLRAMTINAGDKES